MNHKSDQLQTDDRPKSNDLINPDERFRYLDALRAVALLGVCFVNAETLFRVSIFQHIVQPHTDLNSANVAVDRFLSSCVEFKAFAMFSIMFGIGLAIQMHSQTKRGSNAKLFIFRRLLILLAIGLVHLFFVWNGDILTFYALCGFVLIPFVDLHPALQAVASVVALFALPNSVIFRQTLPADSILLTHAGNAVYAYTSGSFLEILKFRFYETIHLILPLSLHVLPKIAGYMLLGMALWRAGLLNAIKVPSDSLPIKILSAPGRMALTNYLAESIIFSFIFYSYGLGLMGKLGSAPTALIAIALFALQVAISNWWLSKFYFGPVEWLWRSLSYGQRAPFLRT